MWFWLAVAVALALALAAGGRYRTLAARARRAAVRRRLVELPAGAGIDRAPRRLAAEPGLLALLAGAWVLIGPWTWGYDDVEGAIASAAISGSAVILLSLAATIFPALWALVLLAGSWLLIAPWVVGYGDADGPVGLSDTIAGAALSALAVAGLAAAQRAVRRGRGAGGPQPFGRLRRGRSGD